MQCHEGFICPHGKKLASGLSAGVQASVDNILGPWITLNKKKSSKGLWRAQQGGGSESLHVERAASEIAAESVALVATTHIP